MIWDVPINKSSLSSEEGESNGNTSRDWRLWLMLASEYGCHSDALAGAECNLSSESCCRRSATSSGSACLTNSSNSREHTVARLAKLEGADNRRTRGRRWSTDLPDSRTVSQEHEPPWNVDPFPPKLFAGIAHGAHPQDGGADAVYRVVGLEGAAGVHSRWTRGSRRSPDSREKDARQSCWTQAPFPRNTSCGEMRTTFLRCSPKSRTVHTRRGSRRLPIRYSRANHVPFQTVSGDIRANSWRRHALHGILWDTMAPKMWFREKFCAS
jgi:hypothetical protein